MQKRALQVLLAIVLATTPAAAQSVQNIVLRNSFNPVGAGARGLGMGGAFIAVADDGTAASFNPAGLAQLRRSELAIVGFTDRLESTVRLGGAAQENAQRHSAPDFVGLAVPFEAGKRQLTVQLSYQRSVDLFGRGSAAFAELVDLADFGFGGTGSAIVETDVRPRQSGAFHTGSLSAGLQLTPRLAVGASANVWVAEWTAEGSASFGVETVARPGRPSVDLLEVESQFRQEQSMRGVNFSAGMLLRYPRLSVGGIVRLPFSGDYDLHETGLQVNQTASQPVVRTNVDLVSRSSMKWPLSAGAGLALHPFDRLTLAVDYTWSHWSRTTIEDVPAGALLTSAAEGSAAFTSRNFFDLRPAPLTGTRDTHQVRAGGEFLVNLPWLVIPLRGGWFEDRSPVASAGEEGRRIRGFTVGTGLNFNRVVLDVAFERRRSDGSLRLVTGGNLQRVADSVGESLETPREDVEESRIVASLIWRFGGASDPFEKLFRKLFVGPPDEEAVTPE